MRKGFAILVAATLLSCYANAAYSNTYTDADIDADIEEIESIGEGPVPGSAFNLTPDSPERKIDRAAAEGIERVEKAVEAAKAELASSKSAPDSFTINADKIAEERARLIEEQGKYALRAVSSERDRAVNWLVNERRAADTQRQEKIVKTHAEADDAAKKEARKVISQIASALSRETVSAKLDEAKSVSETATESSTTIPALSPKVTSAFLYRFQTGGGPSS